MAELKISAEALAELDLLVKRLSAGNVKDVEKDFKKIQKQIEISPDIRTKGTECSGCNSCGACPVAYIKAGYLIWAFVA